jgi:predicted nucleic acid-binding protein
VRVFLDANILFSAAATPDGRAALLIEHARASDVAFLTCDLAVTEARRNLQAKSPARVGRLDVLLKRVEAVPTVTVGACPIPLPAKDAPILLSAISAGATHFLTGDIRDFGRWMNMPARTGGVVVQSMADFLR